MLSEEHSLALSLGIEFVENGLSVFLNACCKHDDLEALAHCRYEFFSKRPDVDIDCVQVAIQINWLLDIGMPDLLEAGVDQGFIKVKDQDLLACVLLDLRLEKTWFSSLASTLPQMV